MQPISTLQWLTRCAGAVLMLLLTCLLATAWIGPGLQQPATTTRDGTLTTVNRYVREPTPDLVLVGSSVAWRLKEEYFSLPRARNLGLAGGSPVTGLEVIANRPSLPKIVLIETNILSRAVDTSLVEKFSGSARSEPRLLRPVRTAVAAYETWNHPPPDAPHARAIRAQLLNQPPSDFDNSRYLARTVDEMNTEDPSEAARTNVALMKPLIEDLEHRGAQVFLVEIPFAPELANTRYVRMTRAIVSDAFPSSKQWLTIDPPLPELRWADGVHLDERSALLVVQSIEKALAGRDGR